MKFSRRTGLAQYENDIQSQKPRIEDRRRIHRFTSRASDRSHRFHGTIRAKITQIDTDVGDLC
jgi:hypothetical protein